MEETGQLARAKALLHLLLEASDEQHLAQEVAQSLVGHRPAFRDLGHSF
jgi:hypothetical protein